MIEITIAAISVVMGYLFGLSQANNRITKEEVDTLKALKDEIVELRKWKADNIGKEKANAP